ncbi:MAG: methionine synthase [Alphaproteobacteria bacterium]|jgi:5-methyltetrahydrofolate--homocysteine methyltransferase|nr:methionine synthase [Alphaproteobacteria bacterium]
MPHILDVLNDRVLLCDGGMGSRVQALDLDIERDYLGNENCTEILTRARPDLVREIHRGYLEAGADMVETNTFGGSPITLGEFDLQDEAFELNKRSAELAREATEEFKSDGRDRFVIGAVGPGTKLPSLGHVDYDPLEAALTVQCRGLIAGGVDAILIETCQDTLQIKAAINGARNARNETGVDTPIFVQVTVETTGTLLVGPDIAAAATAIQAMDVPLIGLNCATGPQEMADHVKWLSETWPGLISCQPNAGLPELVDGRTVYPLGPDELAAWLERFIAEDGLNIVGGCCGTDVGHIRALDAMLRRRAGNHVRPQRTPRTPRWQPSVASLYNQVTLRQENAFLAIGERCNANGSKKFRDLQAAEDWDACVAMAREQEKEGSHALDVCTAYVGRDEIADMTALLKPLRGAVTVPLVIDSTEYPVIDEALKLYGGKPIINSINFEDGEEPAEKRVALARKFGTGLIALTIDEEGMAKSADRKLEIAHRLHDFACNRFGLPASDLMFDPLTFTICTGNEDDRKHAIETLDAMERIAAELPDCQIILGLSNISFGLNPAARHVLNSVFLDHAMRRGMTGAIVHVAKIKPLHQIPEEEVKVAEDLIFDRRTDDYDPLERFMALFEGRKAEKAAAKVRPDTIEEVLQQRIVDGDRQGLEEDLDEAMKTYAPLDIINIHLLEGMKVVGELFGAGKMQLPFVLKSAETMKKAVAHLEPHMEKVEGQEKGTIVLATVKGDVHDIGKNLVDIILTNNGYKVVNLGIKQPVTAIMQAAAEHKADCVGMSGLLVKSTVIMKDNLVEMTRQGFDMPIILGGAALTRAYVEEDCVASYGSGRVAYARDAFDGLSLMDKVVDNKIDDHLQQIQDKRRGKPSGGKRRKDPEEEAAKSDALGVDIERARQRRHRLGEDVPVPTPPFWGPRLVDYVAPKALVPFLNERMLFQMQWGYRKDGRRLDEYMAWARHELRPILAELVARCEREDILVPQAVYGYWPAAAEGNDLVLFDPQSGAEAARFTLPRQPKPGGYKGEDGLGQCLTDFFRDVEDEARDVIGLQVVTVGQRASDVAREWFEADKYQDYLYLHGLGVELTEALAEYCHKRIRAELGFAAEDDRDIDKMLQQGYRGSRYSFGYPACPNLEDQDKILALLDAGRIGIELSEEFQLHPEQSTSAIVVHHPKAKYFTI